MDPKAAAHVFVKDALYYLSLTQQGQEIVAYLYSNVFVIEHEKPDYPQ